MLRAPAVSVLLPVHDESGDVLGRAIESILAQTYADFELLVLDDGSQREDTLATLEEYHQRDPRIRLFHEVNRGLTATLNIGLERAAGDLICRQDSDDWSEPTRFARQVQVLREDQSLGVVGSNYMLHREDGAPLWATEMPLRREEILSSFPSMNPLVHGGVCFRTQTVRALGGYRVALDGAEDYDLFWRLCECTGGLNLPEVLYHVRITASSVSATNGLKQARARLITLNLAKMRAESCNEDWERAVQQAEGELANCHAESMHLDRADRLMLAGHYGAAMRGYWTGICASPGKPIGYVKMMRLFLYRAIPTLGKNLFRPGPNTSQV